MARSTPYSSNSSSATSRPANGAPFEPNGTVGLLRRLGDDLATLLRKELALATSEISQSATSAQRGLTGLATGGAVLFAGIIFLLVAATAGLAEVMEVWQAALIVGAIVTIIGYIMVRAGRKKLAPSALRLERTQESLREDRDLLHRRAQ